MAQGVSSGKCQHSKPIRREERREQASGTKREVALRLSEELSGTRQGERAGKQENGHAGGNITTKKRGACVFSGNKGIDGAD